MPDRLRLRRSRRAVAAVAVLVTVSCSSVVQGEGTVVGTAPVASSSQRPMSAGDAAALDGVARQAFAGLADRTPALYVGVWDPQRGYAVKAYGESVVGERRATTEDPLRIGSVTKTFTATAVLELVATGRLVLDGRVEDYLPDLAAAHPPLAGITVEQLLSMHSGLPDYLNGGGIGPALGADPHRVWKPRELVDAALRSDARPAGTAGYSNTNYVLLQMLAEQVTGSRLADLVGGPTRALGLAHTTLPADAALPAPVGGYLGPDCVAGAEAIGVDGLTAGEDVHDWNPSYAAGAGAVVSTLADLGTWAASTSGSDLLPPDLRDRRLRTEDIGDGVQYGLGIIRYGDWVGHDGEIFGWQTLAVHAPQQGPTVVIAANACGGLLSSFLDLLRRLYPDIPA